MLERLQETAAQCKVNDTFVDASLRLMGHFPELRQMGLGNRVVAALTDFQSSDAENSGDALMHITLNDPKAPGLVSVNCLFGQESACHNDVVDVTVVVTSKFPVPLKCRIPNLVFSDDQYNCELTVGGDGEASTDGTIELPVDVPVTFLCQIKVDSSQSTPQDDDNEITHLRMLRISTTLLDTSGSLLCTADVRVDNDGSRSIQSTTTLAAAARTSSAAAGTNLSKHQRQRERKHWLAIVPPVALATVAVENDSCALFGAAHQYVVRLCAADDACHNATLRLQMEGIRLASADEDLELEVAGVTAAEEPGASGDKSEFNFVDGSEQEHVAIDAETGNCEPIPVPDLAPGQVCCVVLRITCRAVQKFHMSTRLRYNNVRDVTVTTTPTACSWRCANPVEVKHFIDYHEPNVWPWLSLGQPFVLRSEYSCNSAHPVEILQVETKEANKAVFSQPVQPVWQQQPPGVTVRPLASLAPGDVYSTFSKFVASQPFRGQLGVARVHWQHTGAGQSMLSSIEREFPLPELRVDRIPVVVTIDVPALVHCGQVFTVKLRLANQTQSLQSLRVVRSLAHLVWSLWCCCVDLFVLPRVLVCFDCFDHPTPSRI